MADRTETIILETEIDVESSIESIDNLTKANKELRKERNALNLQSEAGKKRAQEINHLLDDNTNKIKANVSALEKQKINIGNYKSALEGVVPGLSNVSAGVEKASGAVKLFRLALGPIGIVLGLISGALALLGKYLFGTQEGMDKVTAITRPLLAVFDRLTGVVQQLGGRLFKALGDAIQNPIQAIKDLGKAIVENILNRFNALALVGPAIAKIFGGDLVGGFKDLGNAAIQGIAGIENGIDKIQAAAAGISDFVDEAIKQGQRLDELQKQIERGEIDRITRSKELELIVKRNKAIVEDETKSLVAREAAAERARAAQDQNEREGLALLDKRIEKIKLQQSLNDTSREDEKELAELVAQRLEIQARTAEQAIEFDKKLNELRKKQVEEAAAAAAEARAQQRQQLNVKLDTKDPLVGAFQTQANLIDNIDERMKKDLEKRNNEFNAQRLESAQKTAEALANIQQQEVQAVAGFLGAVSGLLNRQSDEYKAVATFQAIVSTYSTAQKAFEAAYTPPTVASPVLAGLYVASAIATGLANVARINGIEFAEGGIVLKGKSHKEGGIPIVAEGNEIIMTKGVYQNPELRRAASAINVAGGGRSFADGGIVTSSISQPINQQLELLNIVKNLPPQELDVSEVSLSDC